MRYATAFFTPLALAAALASAPAFAETTVNMDVLHKIVVLDANGNETVGYEEIEKAIPGEQLTYRISLDNSDETPATAIALAMNIDPSLAIDPDSFFATEEATGFNVLFSTDNGETFAPYETLRVEDESGLRAATPDDLTTMQIDVTELAPETLAVIEYTAVIR